MFVLKDVVYKLHPIGGRNDRNGKISGTLRTDCADKACKIILKFYPVFNNVTFYVVKITPFIFS